jgi:hypothetical protein
MSDLSLNELGTLAAELMDRLESDYEGKEDVELGVVAIVVELNYTDSDGEEITAVEYRCSDARRWIQSGLFAAAGRGVIVSSENPE